MIPSPRPNRSEQHLPPTGRIDAFDALRSLMIGLVVVAHVSMTYMPHAAAWWYVVSEKTDPVFLIVVNILDVCIMPVLFFLSGYFSPASYLKKGFAGFLRDKVRHILLPWIVGIVVLVPVALLVLGGSVGDLTGLLKEAPLYLFDEQSHLWYLAILFLFLLGYALWARFVPPSDVRKTASGPRNIRLLLVTMVISAVGACLATIYIKYYDGWIDVARLITLRPVKIVGYICLFMLGAYAWRANWFTAEGWMPRIGPWRILAAGSLAAYLATRLLIIPAYDAPLLKTVLLPTLDVILSFTSLMYLLPTGIKFQKSRAVRWLVKMSPYSYGIYWIHTLPMFFYLRAVNDWDVPIFFKWMGGIVFTTAFCWLITKYVLRKAPGFRKMF